MGLIRVELMTPSLSEKCSNQLSYSPSTYIKNRKKKVDSSLFSHVHHAYAFLLERR